MKGSLLKRLFAALESNSPDDVVLICNRIVSDERTLGHTHLADQLQGYVSKLERADRPRQLKRAHGEALKPLPSSRRESAPLVQILEHDQLRHHMVLPSAVEARFQRIEKEFAARSRLAKYGLPASRRVLLYGPPGCGKSLGAERLAWSTGLPLYKVRFDTLISSYFGETATNLQRVFEASQEIPCALFLDECDTIAQERGRSQDVGEVSRIVNMLLQLLEDFRGDGLVIAATNFYESLDRALFRRFDSTIQMPLPGTDEIVRLLETTLSALAVERNLDYNRFSRSLDGYSCSDIAKIAQDAAKRSVLSGEQEITLEQLESAASDVKRHD